MSDQKSISYTIYTKAALVTLLGITTALIGTLMGLNTQQTLALTVFLIKTYATLFLWSYRLPFGFLGLFALFFLGLIDIKYFIDHSHLDVIVFLIALMTIIGYLEEDQFFEFITRELIRRFGFSFKIVFMVIFFLSGFLAPLVDEVTAVLIMSSIVFSLSDRLGIDPFPLTLAVIFSVVIGGSITPLGNPVSILIAFESGYSFVDFLRWAAPISILSLLVTNFLLLRRFRSYIEAADVKLEEKIIAGEGLERIDVPRQILLKDASIFLATLFMLALHHTFEELMGLGKNILLLAIPFLMTGIILIMDPEKGFKAFEHRVEWPTLVFFLTLFTAVGALDKVGIIRLLAEWIASFKGMGTEILIVIFTVLTVPMSAFMDNVVAASIFAQVIHNFENVGINTAPFWWLALINSVYAASLTPIGSTANIVVAGILEKRYKKPVSFAEWIKHGIPVALATITLAVLLICLQLPLMQHYP